MLRQRSRNRFYQHHCETSNNRHLRVWSALSSYVKQYLESQTLAVQDTGLIVRLVMGKNEVAFWRERRIRVFLLADF